MALIYSALNLVLWLHESDMSDVSLKSDLYLNSETLPASLPFFRNTQILMRLRNKNTISYFNIKGLNVSWQETRCWPSGTIWLYHTIKQQIRLLPINGWMYKRSFVFPVLKYLHNDQVLSTLRSVCDGKRRKRIVCYKLRNINIKHYIMK